MKRAPVAIFFQYILFLLFEISSIMASYKNFSTFVTFVTCLIEHFWFAKFNSEVNQAKSI